MDMNTEVFQKAILSNTRAVLIEGFDNDSYKKHISILSEIVRSNNGLVFDFYDALSLPLEEISNIAIPNLLFLYNLNLFNDNLNPEYATEVMGYFRAKLNKKNDLIELMVASPDANLDFNSQPGFTFRDNHPLGNWCEFYRIKNGALERAYSPICHRD